MNGVDHERITNLALESLPEYVLKQLNNEIRETLAKATASTDDMLDLEAINVEATNPFGDDLDDPHVKEKDKDDDQPHFIDEWFDKNFTAFNHFIDIKKGPGIFDDYDGYSYHKGSASNEQYMHAVDDDGAPSWSKYIPYLDLLGNLDDVTMTYYNDEYIHAPCHKWYRGYPLCSYNLANYSFPHDKGIYKDILSELSARFPLAQSFGKENMGIPYSVFMPVDNLARYWYYYFIENYGKREDAWVALGRVMHAIQDASIPHHAAGYLGNWHSKYENDLQANNEKWIDMTFRNNVKILLSLYNQMNQLSPIPLITDDITKKPGKNWRIDMLVTWVALNAYNEYNKTHNRFKNGYVLQVESMKMLTKIAVAVSAVALLKAFEAVGIIHCSLREISQKAGYYGSLISVLNLASKFGLKPPFSVRYLSEVVSKN